MALSGTSTTATKVMSQQAHEVPKLVGQENVFLWRRRVKAALKAREVWSAVDVASTGADNDKAVGVLVASLSDQVLCMLSEENSAHEMWKELNALYQKKDVGRIILVEEQIFAAKMSPAESAESHIARMNQLFAKLAGAGGTLDDAHKARQMLRSLDAQWDVFVQMQGARENLQYGQVCSAMLMEYERRAATTTAVNPEHKALAADTRGASTSRTCFYCHKRGHIIKNCRKRLADSSKDAGSDEQAAAAVTDNPSSNGGKVGPVCFYSSANTHKTSRDWIVDSGASAHMTPYRSQLTNIRKLTRPCSVKFGDGRSTSVRVGGTLAGGSLQGQRALLVPQLSAPLLSVRALTEDGATCTFGPGAAYIVAANGNETSVSVKNGVYILPSISGGVTRANAASVRTKLSGSYHLWHERLAHPGEYVMDHIGCEKSGAEGKGVCEVCQRGKQPRRPFGRTNERKNYLPGEKLHTDLCGPISPISEDGYSYDLTLTDDASRLTYVKTLRAKSEAAVEIESFVIATERQYGWKLKVLRSDRGGEFVNSALGDFLKSRGIKAELTAPYSPQMNGVAERVNRTLLDRARCMILQAKLGKQFWSHALRHASVIMNRVPRQSLDGRSPLEVGFNRPPAIDMLRVFGCRAYVGNVGPRDKLADRACPGVYLGFDNESKSHKVWMDDACRMTVSRDVVFDETVFPGIGGKEDGGESTAGTSVGSEGTTNIVGGASGGSPSQATVPISFGRPESLDVLGDRNEVEGSDRSEDGNRMSSPSAEGGESVGDEHEPSHEGSENGSEKAQSQQSVGRENVESAHSEEPEVERRRSSRQTTVPGGIWGKRWNSVNQSNFTQAMRHDNSVAIPQSYRQAMKSPESAQWKKAMEDELKSHVEKGSWSMVKLPAGKRAIRNRWVFAVKKSADGKTVRHKARLCAKGFEQRQGVDYESTYAPVATLTTVRLLLSLAAKLKMSVHHLDVKTAFLNSDLDEDVYMQQPEGFTLDDSDDLVCKLIRAIYGLKQASRQWYRELDAFLMSLRARKSGGDSTLYWFEVNGAVVLLVVYVDDILIASKSDDSLAWLKETLMGKYEMTDMGPVSLMLGIEIETTENGTRMHQSGFIQEILAETDMDKCNPTKAPMEHGLQLRKAGPSETPLNQDKYRRVLGQLQYLVSGTRPDLAFCVSYLSRFCQCPLPDHWAALKRVLRYLCGTAKMGIFFAAGDTGMELTGYSDADWAGDRLDRKSMSGFLFFVGMHLVSWGSKKQDCVSLSTMEAEYVALARAVQEMLWLRKLSVPKVWSVKQPTLFVDNQSAQAFASGTAESNQSKHIDLRYHFVRDLMEKKEMKIEYKPTDEMTADIMTKALGPIKFVHFRNGMMDS